MKQTVMKYVEMLAKLQIPENAILQTSEIFSSIPQVKETLADPGILLYKKHHLIETVFPKKVQDVLKLLCDDQEIALWDEIVEKRKQKMPQSEECLEVVLTYVTAPTEEQLEGIKNFLKKKYGAKEIHMVEKIDASIGGGFKLQVGMD